MQEMPGGRGQRLERLVRVAGRGHVRAVAAKDGARAVVFGGHQRDMARLEGRQVRQHTRKVLAQRQVNEAAPLGRVRETAGEVIDRGAQVIVRQDLAGGSEQRRPPRRGRLRGREQHGAWAHGGCCKKTHGR